MNVSRFKEIYSLGRPFDSLTERGCFTLRRGSDPACFGNCAMTKSAPADGWKDALSSLSVPRFFLTDEDGEVENHLIKEGYVVEKECEAYSLSLSDRIPMDGNFAVMDCCALPMDGGLAAMDCLVRPMDGECRKIFLQMKGYPYPVDGKGRYFVVRKETTVPAAFCSFKLIGKTAVLGDVFTRPDFRRKGYAAEVLRAALSYAKGKGAKQACLVTEATNEGAKKLYRFLGFEKVFDIRYRKKGE